MPHRDRPSDSHTINPTARYNLGRSQVTGAGQKQARNGAGAPHDMGDNVPESSNSRREPNTNFGGSVDDNNNRKAKNINLPRNTSRMRGLMEQKNKAMPHKNNLHRQCEPLKLLEFHSEELVNDEREERGPRSPWRLGPSAS